MTNEEAKRRLEVWLKCMDCPEDKQCYDSHLHSTCEYTDYCDETPVSEAVKVAIQALSQEPIKYWIDHNGHVIPIQQPCDTENCKIVKALIGDPCKVNEPCEDAISRQAVLDTLDTADKFLDEDRTVERYKAILTEAYKVLPSANPQETKTEWIPMTTRPMTEEEREHYREWYDVDGDMIFDCELPEDGQDVLVSYGGYVCVDTFCKDDGCYFEGVDIDEVDAWMSLPEPYKESEG